MASKSGGESPEGKPIVKTYIYALSRLGYTKTLAEKRIALVRNFSECLTKVHERNWNAALKEYVVGSRGEGMAVGVYSDFDCICIHPAVKCFETRELEPTIKGREYIAAFELDFINSPEGYAKLRLMSIKLKNKLPGDKEFIDMYYIINNALDECNGITYLRNDHNLIRAVENADSPVTREGFVSTGYEYGEKTGPASPHHIRFGDFNLNVDHVQGFACYYPSVLTAWHRNKASTEWPSQETIEKVKCSQVFVVPTGEPKTDDVFNWRISFTFAEQVLVHSFNDIQIKVYAVLKMLTKQHLKPKCSAMTSYIAKNIVFWASEQTHWTYNEEEDFIDLLSKVLGMLRDVVYHVNLRSYMLPSKNLLKGRITETEKDCVLECLDAMLKEGPHVTMWCRLVKEFVSNQQEKKLELEKKLTIRTVVDEIVYSLMILSPDKFDEYERLLHKANSIEKIFQMHSEIFFSFVKINNPFDYFNRIKNMTPSDIVSCFLEGIREHLDEWMDICLDDSKRANTVRQLNDFMLLLKLKENLKLDKT